MNLLTSAAGAKKHGQQKKFDIPSAERAVIRNKLNAFETLENLPKPSRSESQKI
jgi:hypothetical protein